MTTVARNEVLVVEDDDSMREAIARLLDAAGYESTTFASAEALLSSGAEKTAGCVVSDQRLPAMSGLELLTHLRARGEWPALILITAHDEPGLRDEAIRRGAAAYLVKPFLGAALLDAIQVAARRSAPS